MASATQRKTIQANVRLRFRPAESKLAQQLRDAATALDQGTASAHSVAATVRQAAAAAIPQITAAVAKQQGLSDQLRSVAPPLDPGSGFGKAAAIESQGAQRRLGELQTNAVADYVAQQARAGQGEAFQISNLQNRHAAAVDRIGQQAVDLKLQEGDYAGSLAGKYADKALEHAFSRAQQKRSFAHSDAAREDSQAHSDAAEARRVARQKAKDDKSAAKRKAGERKLQRKFEGAVAKLGLSTYDVQRPGKTPGTTVTVKVPITADYVTANRQTVEAGIRAGEGLSPEMARRVVEAFLRGGQAAPGSFKRYRRQAPKRLGGNPVTG